MSMDPIRHGFNVRCFVVFPLLVGVWLFGSDQMSQPGRSSPSCDMEPMWPTWAIAHTRGQDFSLAGFLFREPGRKELIDGLRCIAPAMTSTSWTLSRESEHKAFDPSCVMLVDQNDCPGQRLGASNLCDFPCRARVLESESFRDTERAPRQLTFLVLFFLCLDGDCLLRHFPFLQKWIAEIQRLCSALGNVSRGKTM